MREIQPYKSVPYPNRIRECIKKYGYTHIEVAEEIGIGRRTLDYYIAGQRVVPHSCLEKIANIIGCTIEELLIPRSLADRQQEPLLQQQLHIPAHLELGDESMERKRREVLHLLAIANAVLLRPFSGFDWERIEKAIAKPASVDENVIRELEPLNGCYWNIYKATTSKYSVLDGVLGQLRVLVQLIKQTHSASLRRQLCALISDLSQLAGESFFDAHDYISAQSCYTFAVAAAKEAQHYDLWACALTRNAYLYLDDESYHEALSLLEEANHIVLRGDTSLVSRFWIAAVEAEALAGLGNLAAYQGAFECASGVNYSSTPSPLWLRFEGSRLPALQGNCLVRLGLPDAAELILKQALASVPNPTRRRAMVFTDLATTAVQQNQIEQACMYVGQAIEIAQQGTSLMLRDGIFKVCEQLKPFADTKAVKELDQQFAFLR